MHSRPHPPLMAVKGVMMKNRRSGCMSLLVLAVPMLVAGSTAVAIDRDVVKQKKTEVDIVGIRLGMPIAEAEAIARARHPNGVFVEFVDVETRQPAGWNAAPAGCNGAELGIDPSGPCAEILRVRHDSGRVWRVEREVIYDFEQPEGRVPTIEATAAALTEKFGPLLDAKPNPLGLAIDRTFDRDSRVVQMRDCGSAGANRLHPETDWHFSISAILNSLSPHYISHLRITIADCALKFGAVDARARPEEEQRRRLREQDVANGVRPDI